MLAGMRAAAETLYTGRMDVIEYRLMEDEKTGISRHQEVVVLENIPCRLSYGKAAAVTDGSAAENVTRYERPRPPPRGKALTRSVLGPSSFGFLPTGVRLVTLSSIRAASSFTIYCRSARKQAVHPAERHGSGVQIQRRAEMLRKP